MRVCGKVVRRTSVWDIPSTKLKMASFSSWSAYLQNGILYQFAFEKVTFLECENSVFVAKIEFSHSSAGEALGKLAQVMKLLSLNSRMEPSEPVNEARKHLCHQTQTWISGTDAFEDTRQGY